MHEKTLGVLILWTLDFVGRSAMGRLRRGLLTVEVLNFEDLTEDACFGGPEFEPAPHLLFSLIAPELQRWTENGLIPQPLCAPTEAPLLSAGLGGGQATKGPKTVEPFKAVAGVACVGCPLLYIECRSLPKAPEDGQDVPDAAQRSGEHVPQICTELISTEEMVDPQEHVWELERQKEGIRRQIEEKQRDLDDNPKDKELEREIQELEVQLDNPLPLPPPVEKNVTLLLDDGRKGARISISLALNLDPEAHRLDESAEQPEAAGGQDADDRPEKCPRPVEEAFEAATSVLDTAISNAVDTWLDLVFDRRARQYATSYCLLAATAVIEMGLLQPSEEPEALTMRAHRKARAQTQDIRPLSARLQSSSAPHSARLPRSSPLLPTAPNARPSPFSSPNASPRPPSLSLAGASSQRASRPPLCPPLAVDGAEANARLEDEALPFWGYVDEEVMPAPIDSMARGVVPVRFKPTGDMTDDFLSKMQNVTGVTGNMHSVKPPAGVSSLRNQGGKAPLSEQDSKDAPILGGVGKVGASAHAHVAGRLRPASGMLVNRALQKSPIAPKKDLQISDIRIPQTCMLQCAPIR